MLASRPAIAAALLSATLAPFPAMAQTAPPSLWDYFSPERLIQRGVQSGIMALRTQMDIKYGGIDVDALRSVVTLTNVVIWPLPEWDTEAKCEIRINRLTIRSAAVDEPDVVRVKAQASGATAPVDCLPPDARAVPAMLQTDRLSLSRLTFDMEYHIGSASAGTHLFALADGLAAVDLTADFDYLWFDGRNDMESPDPVVTLSSAQMTVENLGVWDAVKGQLPPPLTDPGSAALVIQAGANQSIAQANGPSVAMSASQEAFVASLGVAWASFVQSPMKLLVETGFDPASGKFLDFKAMESDPRVVFDTLEPRVALSSATARAMLPATLIKKADEPAALSPEEALAVGTAFATGIGAPRDVGAARILLAPLAQSGDGAASLTLARVLETRDAEGAYSLALTAAADGQDGAAALLDRVESVLPFARVLELQSELIVGVQHPVSALEQLSSIRSEAAMRLTGTGRTRSYATAVLWALLATAAGDAEGADILAEIDERVRLAGPDAATVWQGQEAAATKLALDAWVGFDLPAAFGRVD